MTAPGAQQPHPRATAMGATDSPRAPISIQWRGKLRNLLQAAAFCLLIAALLYALQPDRPWPPHVAYSLSIGLITWALIDLGRHAFPSARETGWPQGVWGFVLVAGSIAAGFFGGTALGGFVCESLGLYGGYPPAQDLSKEFRRTLLISVGAGLVGTFYFYSRSRGVYLERARAEAMRHATEARLKLLETQLEPHMLFNTLANLRALIGVDPERAQQMLDHLIAYLRATLGASRAITHSVSDEFARLGDYLALMSVRMGPRLAYSLEVPPALAACAMPPLLLQPLVENSIRHGLEPRLEGGRIAVSARSEGTMLWLEVRDTGLGLRGGATLATASSGFGLTQVRERLATLYGDAAGLELVDDAQGGVRAMVHLPLAP